MTASMMHVLVSAKPEAFVGLTVDKAGNLQYYLLAITHGM